MDLFGNSMAEPNAPLDLLASSNPSPSGGNDLLGGSAAP